MSEQKLIKLEEEAAHWDQVLENLNKTIKERKEKRKKRKRELIVNRRTKDGRRLERERSRKRTRVWSDEEKETRRRIRERWYELCDQRSEEVWSFDYTRNDDRQVPLRPEWKKGFRIVRTEYLDPKPRYRLWFNGSMRYCYCCNISELRWKCCTKGF